MLAQDADSENTRDVWQGAMGRAESIVFAVHRILLPATAFSSHSHIRTFPAAYRPSWPCNCDL